MSATKPLAKLIVSVSSNGVATSEENTPKAMDEVVAPLEEPLEPGLTDATLDGIKTRLVDNVVAGKLIADEEIAEGRVSMVSSRSFASS